MQYLQAHCKPVHQDRADQSKKAGCHLHTRYLELTGWKAPAAGGPATRTLDQDQRALDKEARAVISNELGNNRESISAIYLGR